ncbi:MAG: hypothetical protein GWO86_03335, partial [Planctomycetes bacterium]|nr:hypothetical protein [Planctomycetota bacterium]
MSSSDQKPSEHVVKTGRKSRILLRIGIVLVLIILLLFFITPVLVSSQGGRNMIVDKINNAIDGKIKIQKLSMGWFKGVELAGVRFDDESGKTSVTAGKISAKPSY